ncbi:MAG TPA: hypothetical protein VIV58_21975 [Kofleriaceae bacterium]
MIWIVTGSSGDYSDHTMWVVCWRHTEEEAVAVQTALTTEVRVYRETCQELRKLLGPYSDAFEEEQAKLARAAIDARIDEWAEYRVQPVADDARAFALELAARAKPEPVILDDGTVAS